VNTVLTQEEKAELFGKLGITESEARDLSVHAYNAAWDSLDAAVTQYGKAVIGKVPGALAYVIWDAVLREMIAQHERMEDDGSLDEAAA
jgi:hypothetical protein